MNQIKWVLESSISWRVRLNLERIPSSFLVWVHGFDCPTLDLLQSQYPLIRLIGQCLGFVQAGLELFLCRAPYVHWSIFFGPIQSEGLLIVHHAFGRRLCLSRQVLYTFADCVLRLPDTGYKLCGHQL